VFTPYSWITYDGDGTTATFGIPFPYVAREHVHVYIGWDPSARSFTTELEHGVDFTFASGNEITTTAAPGALEELTILRITPIEQPLSDWQTGSPPTARELDVADRQVLYSLQEFIDQTLQAREDLDAAVLTGTGVVLIDNLNSSLTTAGLTANMGQALRLLVEAAQSDADAAGTSAGLAAAAAVAAQATADAALAAICPPSTIAFVARSTAPAGWLKANGAAVSRTTYAPLFDAIGTTFGAGNGTTTFNLPDLRGEFPRGWDDGRGIDTGRAFGSAQLDALQNLLGTVGNVWGTASPATGVFTSGVSGASNQPGTGGNGSRDIGFNASLSAGARTAAETRPRNIALLAVVKF